MYKEIALSSDHTGHTGVGLTPAQKIDAPSTRLTTALQRAIFMTSTMLIGRIVAKTHMRREGGLYEEGRERYVYGSPMLTVDSKAVSAA